MEDRRIISRLIRHKLLIIVSLIALAGVFLASRYSFISIEVTGADVSSGQLKYKLLNQSSQKIVEVDTGSTNFKRLVQKGEYEVLVTQSGKGSFSLATAGGFLRLATVQAKLSPEKQRNFVGDNPGSCMFLKEKLYSYECNGLFNKIRAHEPATTEQPTHTTEVSPVIEGSIEGILQIQNSTVAVVHSSGDDSVPPKHIGYVLGDGFKPSEEAVLKGLDDNKDYLVQPFREGFLMYDNSLSKAMYLYYPTIKSQPELVSLGSPSNKALRLFLLNAHGDSLVVLYSNSTEGEDPEHPDNSNVKNEAIIFAEGNLKKFSFNGQTYSSVSLCGDRNLCLMGGDKELFVYDVSSQKPKYLFRLSGVSFMKKMGNRLIVVRDNEILNINPNDGSGFIDYSLGEYEYCGVQGDASGYVLCLINVRGKKVALRIDTTALNNDSIDKKIQALQGLSEISDISIYDKYIYISPELGPIEYDSATRGFGYNSETKKRVAAKIDEEVNRLGIDRSLYTIINTIK